MILVIAHRIKAVVDSDRIAWSVTVPQMLLKNQGALFFRLVLQAGEV